MDGNESARGFVCWSCHNGSVVDSRAKIGTGGQHPVSVRVPNLSDDRLKLYSGKTLECGTCHSPHGEHPGADRWLRIPDTENQICSSCHESFNHFHQGKSVTPTIADKVRSRGGAVGRDGSILCRSCHTPHGARGPDLLIMAKDKPGSRGGICKLCHEEKVSVAMGPEGLGCAECHGAHVDNPRGFVIERPCLDCHSNRTDEGNHRDDKPGCTSCHSIHDPVQVVGGPGDFLRTANFGANLCSSCHVAVFGRHSPNSKVDEETAIFIANKGFRKPGPEGMLECSTCHSVHNAPKPGLMRRHGSISCLYCHQLQNPYMQKSGTHPVGVFLDRYQRNVLEVAGKGTAGEREMEKEGLFCLSCHSAHIPEGTNEAPCIGCHLPQNRASNHGNKKGCSACHPIHGEKPPSKLCAECHESIHGELHPPELHILSSPLPLYDSDGIAARSGKISCPTCHDLHSSNRKLLAEKTPEELCIRCHTDRADISANIHYGKSLEGDTPTGMTGDGCMPCHDPHKAQDLDKLLTTLDTAGQICFECHDSRHTSLISHTPMGIPAWKIMTGEQLPLFNILGKRDKLGFMSCSTCHNVHDGSGAGSFRVPYDDPPTLCITCHAAEATILGTAHDPANEGSTARCTKCHSVHSIDERPAAWDLRIQGVGTWNDRKCMPCHHTGPLDESPYHDPTSHPVNVALEFGKSLGSLPLFDAMGDSGGTRVVCSTCHNIHGALSGEGDLAPKFLRDDPSTGRLCRDCHMDKDGVVDTPHDLDEQWDSSLGNCGPCHIPHGAWSDRALWGLEPGSGEYKPDTLCRSCHTAESGDKDKPQLMQYHIKDAEPAYTDRGTIQLQWPMILIDQLAIKRGASPTIALYEKDGTEKPFGSLQCASCHDPHQWSAFNPSIKPGMTIGPNIMGNFIRFSDLQFLKGSVCNECHAEGLDNYFKRYHEVWQDVGDSFQRLHFFPE